MEDKAAHAAVFCSRGFARQSPKERRTRACALASVASEVEAFPILCELGLDWAGAAAPSCARP
eukprot:13764300-Alexandrium_andersonii.AAC.1